MPPSTPPLKSSKLYFRLLEDGAEFGVCDCKPNSEELGPTCRSVEKVNDKEAKVVNFLQRFARQPRKSNKFMKKNTKKTTVDVRQPATFDEPEVGDPNLGDTSEDEDEETQPVSVINAINAQLRRNKWSIIVALVSTIFVGYVLIGFV